MKRNTFSINVVTINGQMQENPVPMVFVCNEPIAVGETVLRDYDDNNCIVAKKVFLFRVNENVFGTFDFKTKSQFWNYQQALCVSCPEECRIIWNDCLLEWEGCNLALS